MRDLCRLIGWMVVDLIRSRATLEAEIWTLRQQINVLRRGAPRKLSFCAVDRMIFVGLYRMFPKICDALAIDPSFMRPYPPTSYAWPSREPTRQTPEPPEQAWLVTLHRLGRRARSRQLAGYADRPQEVAT